MAALLLFVFIALLYANTTLLEQFTAQSLSYACFGVVAVSHTVVTLLETKYLSCPACGAIPARNGNLELDLEACERCGAQLK